MTRFVLHKQTNAPPRPFDECGEDCEKHNMEEIMRQIVERPAPREIEIQMREQLAEFRTRLESHPYVTQASILDRVVAAVMRPAGLTAAAAMAILVVGGFALLHLLAPEVLVARAGNGVGPVLIGMASDAVASALGSPEAKLTNGAYCYYSKGVEVGFGKTGVDSIACQSARYSPGYRTFRGHTTEGIAVGASEADVVTAYGAPDHRFEIQTTQDGHSVAAAVLAYNRGVKFQVAGETEGAGATTSRVGKIIVVPAVYGRQTALAIYRRGSLGLYAETIGV